jgi:HPt (histidine-containing phosphotransfer) domain-containing protein
MDPVNLSNLRILIDSDPVLEQALIAEFYTSCDDCLAGLTQSFEDDSNESWRQNAHALKGIAVNLGADRLGELAKNAQEGAASSAAEKRVMLDGVLHEYAAVQKFMGRN